MAYIEHVHIHASNPAKTIDFFKAFFGAKVIKEFENLGRKLMILSIGDKSNLSILHIPPAVKNPRPEDAGIDCIYAINLENGLGGEGRMSPPHTIKLWEADFSCLTIADRVCKWHVVSEKPITSGWTDFTFS